MFHTVKINHSSHVWIFIECDFRAMWDHDQAQVLFQYLNEMKWIRRYKEFFLLQCSWKSSGK